MLSKSFIPAEQAILLKNTSALLEAVKAGWRWPVYSGPKSGGRSIDTSLLFTVIESDWVEGWEILLAGKQTGQACQSEEVLKQIINTGAVKILKNISQKSFFTPYWRDDFGRNWVHLLFYSLDRVEGHPISSSLLIETVKLLKKSGVNIFEPYPGLFEESDMQRAGHNLWSFALRQKKWDLADKIFPSSIEESGPRIIETLKYLSEIATGQVSDFSITPVSIQVQKIAIKFLKKWWNTFSGECEKLEKEKINKITWEWTQDWNWPLLLKLNPLTQKMILSYWDVPNEEGQTGWHRASQHADDKLFKDILLLASDLDIDLKKAWVKKDNWDTRVIDTATLALGYDIPDTFPFIEAEKRLLLLPKWESKPIKLN